MKDQVATKSQFLPMNIDPLYDFFTGRCIRTITCPLADPQAIYLTFDDGPHPIGTPQVLSLLNKHKIPATFFLIGEKAEVFPELVSTLRDQGHAIADHSIDHNTDNYYKSSQLIGAWLDQSSAKLRKLGLNPVGFRSPLGIKTPALNKALRQRKEPLVLWNVRFYDTNHLLTVEKVEKKISSVVPGSIILLHDTHEGEKLRIFLEALDRFIVLCKEKGLRFSPLKRDLIMGSYKQKYETHE